MWNVDPRLLCRKHLLGEHVEMHMFAGTLKKGISVDGYVRDGLVEIKRVDDRHGELADELVARGYNHASPIFARKDIWSWLDRNADGEVKAEDSLVELARRCVDCRRLQHEETQALVALVNS